MKKVMGYMATGLGIGSFAYLLTLISVKEVTVMMIVSVLIMSALIGLTSMIYEQRRLALGLRAFIHIFLVVVLVAGMLAVNSIFNVLALEITILVYILVLAVVCLVDKVFGKVGEI